MVLKRCPGPRADARTRTHAYTLAVMHAHGPVPCGFSALGRCMGPHECRSPRPRPAAVLRQPAEALLQGTCPPSLPAQRGAATRIWRRLPHHGPPALPEASPRPTAHRHRLVPAPDTLYKNTLTKCLGICTYAELGRRSPMPWYRSSTAA